MAPKSSKHVTTHEITEIMEVSKGQIECYIVGTSPLILNRMSEKAKHELLMPRGRKNVIERATTLKHDPAHEFRASAYTVNDKAAPTYLAVLATSFKKAIRDAAIDMGAKKAQIGRLTYVEGEFIGVYGAPKLFMSIVRGADMNRTPDVRTRAILPEWACRIRITFVQPLIRPQAVLNLLAAAGITNGIGDWRPEKGSGNYGQFRVAKADDPDFKRIVKDGGRSAQMTGLEHATPYDAESAELLTWFDEERAKRNLKGVA